MKINKAKNHYKNAIIITSVASMIIQFNKLNISILKQMGYKVFVASNFSFGNSVNQEKLDYLKKYLINNDIEFYDIPFPRKLYDLINLFRSFLHLNKIFTFFKFNIVHCQSPVASALTRFFVLIKKIPKNILIYTAHGFHFHKKSPLINWIIFFPIEYFFARFTKILITINNEDYKLSKKFFKTKTIFIPGVGVQNSLKPFKNKQKRNGLGFHKSDFILISVGELNRNKNHILILKAFKKITNSRIKFIICGKGPLQKYYQSFINRNNLNSRIKLLGYRDDIIELLFLSDVYINSSLREGLPVSVIEAMGTELPIIGSNIRGVNDLVKQNKNGLLINPQKTTEVVKAINFLYLNNKTIRKYAKQSKFYSRKYNYENVNTYLSKVYSSISTKNS